MAFHVAGLAGKVRVEPADTLDPNDSLRQQNPLGKIPVLVLEDGTTLYDSRVIAEYADHLAGGNVLLPTAGKARFDVLKMQALADGIAEASVLRVYEARFRPEELRSANWLAHQAGKVTAGLATLEAMALPAPTARPDIGLIALACTLGYLDLRFSSWRTDHPRLSAWLDDFAAQVEAFRQTMPAA
jgi:glutathione S-transferase